MPKELCIPIVFAVLFTLVEKWKQLKCPLMDEENVIYSKGNINLIFQHWTSEVMKTEIENN